MIASATGGAVCRVMYRLRLTSAPSSNREVTEYVRHDTRVPEGAPCPCETRPPGEAVASALEERVQLDGPELAGIVVRAPALERIA